jgi:hypothetical protein
MKLCFIFKKKTYSSHRQVGEMHSGARHCRKIFISAGSFEYCVIVVDIGISPLLASVSWNNAIFIHVTPKPALNVGVSSQECPHPRGSLRGSSTLRAILFYSVTTNILFFPMRIPSYNGLTYRVMTSCLSHSET